MRRSVRLSVAIVLASFLAGPFVSAPTRVTAQGSQTGYRMLQLTDSKHDNCFLPSPHSGNPMFGDQRTWEAGTAWTGCTSIYTQTNIPVLPGNFTYAVENGSSGIPSALTVNSANGGWPATSGTYCLGPGTKEYSDCVWYYRGEISFPYTSVSSGGNLSGVYGYDTAGANTQSGNKNDVQVPNTPDMFFAGCTTGQDSIMFPYTVMPGGGWGSCQLSITHPSVTGSSAAVGIAYVLKIPEQVLSDGTTVPPQYAVEIMQYTNGDWTQFIPSNAPDPSQYSIVTQKTAAGNLECLVQTVAPIDIVSGGNRVRLRDPGVRL